jgi:exosortase
MSQARAEVESHGGAPLLGRPEWLAPGVASFLAFAALWLGIQHDVLAQLWRTWGSDAYGHGLLLAPLSLWLLLRALPRVRAEAVAPRITGLLAAGACLGAAVVADLLQVEAAGQALLFLTLAAAARARLGPAARPLYFPLLLPLLAVSLWDGLLGVLQQVTVWLTIGGMALTPIPTYVDANFIHIPAGQFVVETTCAGLRYLLAGLTLAALYGYWYLPGWRARGLLFAGTALWVTFLNGVRVVVVVLMGHALGMDHPWVVDHGDAGWVIFAAGLLPLLWVARRLEGPAEPGAAATASAPAPAPDRLGGPLATGLLLIAALVAGAAEYGASERSLPLAALAVEGGRACTVEAMAESGWAPKFASPSAERCWWVDTEHGTAAVYVAQWARERPGAEMIFYSNDVLGDSRGRLVRRSTREAAGWPVREAWRPEAAPRLVWSSYLVAGRRTASPLVAKLLRLGALVSGAPGSTVVAVSAPVGDGDPDAARRRLAAALARVQPSGGP